MEFQRHQSHCLSERKGQKRKLDENFPEERQISAPPPTADERALLLAEVVNQVNILESTFTWNEADRAAAKRATHALADLAKNGNSMSPTLRSRLNCCGEEVVNVIVEGGAIPALIKHLQAPPVNDCVPKPLPFEHEVEKGSAFALGLLAVK
ncbi:arm repeat protein interacting with abf2-like protein, partial [Trifolium pratense]